MDYLDQQQEAGISPSQLPFSKSWLAWKRWMLFKRVVFIAYAEGNCCITGGYCSGIQFITKTCLWVKLALWHLYGVQVTVSVHLGLRIDCKYVCIMDSIEMSGRIWKEVAGSKHLLICYSYAESSDSNLSINDCWRFKVLLHPWLLAVSLWLEVISLLALFSPGGWTSWHKYLSC